MCECHLPHAVLKNAPVQYFDSELRGGPAVREVEDEGLAPFGLQRASPHLRRRVSDCARLQRRLNLNCEERKYLRIQLDVSFRSHTAVEILVSASFNKEATVA